MEALALNAFKHSKLQQHQGDAEMEMHAGAGCWESTYSVTRVWDNIKEIEGVCHYMTFPPQTGSMDTTGNGLPKPRYQVLIIDIILIIVFLFISSMISFTRHRKISMAGVILT